VYSFNILFLCFPVSQTVRYTSWLAICRCLWYGTRTA